MVYIINLQFLPSIFYTSPLLTTYLLIARDSRFVIAEAGELELLKSSSYALDIRKAVSRTLPRCVTRQSGVL